VLDAVFMSMPHRRRKPFPLAGWQRLAEHALGLPWTCGTRLLHSRKGAAAASCAETESGAAGSETRCTIVGTGSDQLANVRPGGATTRRRRS
jgi:hypothetical protein